MQRPSGEALGSAVERPFAPRPEFDFIATLLGDAALRRDALGPGDDACLWPQADGSFLAVSTDASVESVHYRFDWCTPAEALRKAVLSNLSDINAMGGVTRQLYLSLGLPRAWGLDEARALGEVLRDMARTYGFVVAGGDTVRVPHDSFFAITVLGEVTGRPLLRSAVRPGSTLYVSGGLGASAAGLELLRQASHEVGSAAQRAMPWPIPWAIRAHLKPEPPLALGPALAALNRPERPIAAIDLSDGLSSELWHLSRQSACRIEVEWSKLPYDPSLASLPCSGHLEDWVLNGGEEYQLVFAGTFSEEEVAGLRRHAPVTAIGRAREGSGVYVRGVPGREAGHAGADGSDGSIGSVDSVGEWRPLPAGGFGH